MAIEILFENEAVLACVKPVGVDAQSGMPAQLSREGHGKQILCVHRLDMGVGGVMVYAKTPVSAGELSRQIGSGGLEKDYLAVCAGRLEEEAEELRDLLFKDAAKNRVYPVSRMRKGVKEAALTYRLLAWDEQSDASLVRVHLLTGRSHQIRVQFASRKHPLLGDGKYGSRVKGNGPALWSYALQFHDPATGAPVQVSCLPPEEAPWTRFAGRMPGE